MSELMWMSLFLMLSIFSVTFFKFMKQKLDNDFRITKYQEDMKLLLITPPTPDFDLDAIKKELADLKNQLSSLELTRGLRSLGVRK